MPLRPFTSASVRCSPAFSGKNAEPFRPPLVVAPRPRSAPGFSGLAQRVSTPSGMTKISSARATPTPRNMTVAIVVTMAGSTSRMTLPLLRCDDHAIRCPHGGQPRRLLPRHSPRRSAAPAAHSSNGRRRSSRNPRPSTYKPSRISKSVSVPPTRRRDAAFAPRSKPRAWCSSPRTAGRRRAAEVQPRGGLGSESLGRRRRQNRRGRHPLTRLPPARVTAPVAGQTTAATSFNAAPARPRAGWPEPRLRARWPSRGLPGRSLEVGDHLGGQRHTSSTARPAAPALLHRGHRVRRHHHTRKIGVQPGRGALRLERNDLRR